MKRQRGTTESFADISLRDVYHFLQGSDLSCDELVGLEHEICRLYGIKASTGVIQTFPVDLWIAIFTRVAPLPKLEYDFDFWLDARTVCKAWRASISKMDFSQFVPELEHSKLDINPSHMLKLFHFSTITIISNAVDVDLLTKVKSMTIGENTIKKSQLNDVTKLTQLTHLGQEFGCLPPAILGSLTNLESLSIVDDWVAPKEEIEHLYKLTKLERLVLGWSADSFDQPTLMKHLTRLTDVRVKFMSFWREGKGSCYDRMGDKAIYMGEWLNGYYHGKGQCFWKRNSHKYEGDWYEGKMHGTGRYDYPETGYFEGEFENNFWTKGKRVYSNNGDTYEGDYQEANNHRHSIKSGLGTYHFCGRGAVYEGQFEGDHINGNGKCTYANGDMYDGEFRRGERHGNGLYRCADNSELSGVWENDVFQCPEDDPRNKIKLEHGWLWPQHEEDPPVDFERLMRGGEISDDDENEFPWNDVNKTTEEIVNSLIRLAKPADSDDD